MCPDRRTDGGDYNIPFAFFFKESVANSFETEATFSDLCLSITNGIVSSEFMINGNILILKL